MREICCPTCLYMYAIPELVANKYEQDHKTFFCPQGHPQNYPHLTNYDISQEEIESLKKEIRQLRNKQRSKRGGEITK